MKKKKRSFSGYEEKQSVRIGNEEMILAEKIYAKKPYVVCDYKIWEYANLFTKSMVTNVMMSADYLEVIKEFARRVQISTEILRAERDKRGIPPQLLMARDCVPCGLEKPLLGKIIVCKQEMLHPEFRTIEHQVGLVTIDQGKAIFAKKILTGEDLLWKRSALAGGDPPRPAPAMGYGKAGDAPQSRKRIHPGAAEIHGQSAAGSHGETKECAETVAWTQTYDGPP